LRVALASRSDGGGGITAVYLLHRALRQAGHDSVLFVRDAQSAPDDPTVKTFMPPSDLVSRVHRGIRQQRIVHDFARYRSSRPDGVEIFSDDRTPYGSEVLSQFPVADVVNIHSMFGFVDYRAVLGALPPRLPVVRTLHDMSFFTGGCHLNAGCTKFTEQCGACPQLGSMDRHDLSHQIWFRKDSAIRVGSRDRLWLVAPSQWLASEAKRSSLAGKLPIVVIPNGVDTEAFKPRDKAFARDILGVPPAARVVLFVAESMHRPVKGYAILAEALNRLGNVDNLMLISVGTGRPKVDLQVPNLDLGTIPHEYLPLIYSAADVLVVPSLQENCPLAVLEAMACGIPSIGTAVGGIPELVRPDITGLLVPAKDPAALGTAIRELLQVPAKRSELAVQCRRIAVEEYSLALQVQRYVELYETATQALRPRERKTAQYLGETNRDFMRSTSTMC
jgi:glycosyltransferase involved in cell wall biosynthesis